MRTVLDTNIFISGIFWNGNYCSQIIDAWQTGKIVLVSSFDIIQELVQTMQDFKISLPEESILIWKENIIRKSIIVTPVIKLDIVENDPDDNKFFEAAYIGKADYIISQDKHILNVPEFKGIKTIHPKEFIKLL